MEEKAEKKENEALTIEMANILFEARQARDQWERTARHENAARVAAEKVRDEAMKMRDIAIAEAKEERIISRQERNVARLERENVEKKRENVEKKREEAEKKREEAEKKREEAEKKREEAEKKRDAAMAREASAIKERDAAMAREASAIKERDAAMAREASAVKERDAAMAREASAVKERDAAMARERQEWRIERQRLLDSALTERQGWSTERQGWSTERQRWSTERQGWSTERHRLLDIISIGSAGFANLNDFSRPKIESAAKKLKALTNGDTVKIESRGFFGSTILDKEDVVELKVFAGSQSNVTDSIASDMEERSSKIFTVLSSTVNPTTINDDLCQDWEAVLTKRGISEEVGISAMNVCI
jgi:hypothetical protein